MKSCIATLLLCSGALASNLFGAVSKFNLVALDDGNSISCANSDVRGRVATPGNTALVNYNIACQANIESNPSLSDQCPQFGSWTCGDLAAAGYAEPNPNYYGLIAGVADLGNGLKIQNAQVSGGISYGYGTQLSSTTISNCDTGDWCYSYYPLNWASVSSSLSALSSSIKSRAATGTTTFQYGTLTLVGSGSTDFETFSLNGADLSATNTLAISGVTAQTIFINVNGANVTLQGGAQALKSYSAKIVWNFYEATALNIVNYAVYGAVLAPTANLKNPAGVFWGQVFVNSFVSSSADFWNPSLCAQVNYVPFTGLTPPSGDVCGDGIVQTGEDCDLGAASNGASSSCCSASCTFSPSSQVCRPAAGECDVPETCTGSSATCPTDVFKPEATPCSHPFGICDLELQYHCPGTGAQCVQETPAALFSFDAFNVVSFGNYSCDAGDVEGALAVRNFANLGGFDLGLKLSNNDAYTLFSLAVAGDASWSSGEVHPTTGSLYTYVDVHTNRTISKPWGYIGVGGTFNAPAYLQTSVLQNAYITAQQFDDAQTYYTKIQTLLASLNTNAAVSTIYGDGLQVTCSGDAELYHITVDGATLSTTNWYNTQGCSVRAGWIIDVTGSGDVTIKGAPFPGIVEKVVYNVLGSGRTIYGTNGVNGNILAPQNTYTQSTGVTYGRVIVGNVAQARQNNKPNCTDFSNVIITNAVLKPVTLGDTWIYVVDLDNYVVGDSVCGQGQCVQILQGIEFEGALAGEPKFALVLKAPFPTNLAASSYLSTVVDPNADRSNAITVTKQAAPTATSFDFSGASQVAVPFALLAIIFAMLF